MFCSNKYGLLLILPLLILTAFSCSQQADKTPDQAASADTTATEVPVDSLVITLMGADSVTVLDLLRADHEVDLHQSAMGAFVKAIDSVENEQGYFWLYSVNDSMGKVAGDKYYTSDSDIVKWHYRKIGE